MLVDDALQSPNLPRALRDRLETRRALDEARQKRDRPPRRRPELDDMPLTCIAPGAAGDEIN